MPINIDGKEEFSNREKECLELLKNSNLLEILVTEIHKKIIREDDTIKTVLLCVIGSLVENAKKTSFNLIVNSVTGSGKDWVVENTLGLIPKERWVKRTRITEKTFTYWHNPKFEPEWSWDGKVFYNEDVSNSVLNSDVFKVMSSTGSTATVLVNQKPIDIEIAGTPVIIVTTESPSPSREILRRFSIVNLDESIDQTEAIIDRKLELAKTGETLEYDEKITDTLKTLKRIKVRIPFSDKLKTIFPMNIASHILMRTHTDRFLDFIKSSCALYQFQRQQDKDGYYLATPEDYENARIVLQKITSNPYMIPLTKDEQKIIEIIKSLPEGNYSTKDLEKHIPFISDRTLERKMKKLSGYGLFKVDSEYREQSRGSVTVYKYEPFTAIAIPKYEELINSDDNDDNDDNVANDDNRHISDNPLDDNKNKLLDTLEPQKPQNNFITVKDKSSDMYQKSSGVVTETEQEIKNWKKI